MDKIEPAVFLKYMETELGGKTMAEFWDYCGGGKFYLNLKECRIRLVNLKNRGKPCDETQRAVENWPVSLTEAEETKI